MPPKESRGTSDPATREVHPIAELFPLIEGEEFRELVEDIRRSGLRTPILLDPEGRVLDGRNRLRACRAAAVEPRFETWDGQGSALELVVSLNLRRRHLNESQRAMLAARLKESLAREAAQRRGTRSDLPANWQGSEFGEAAEKAAHLMNVSPRSVHRANKILRLGDRRLILLVESGKLAVSAAATKVSGRKPKARRSVPAPPPSEAVLALWAPPGQVEEVVKLVEQWGFKAASPVAAAASQPHPTLLIASRHNPLNASKAPETSE
jgi:ParB-like chromosome segregation protein Spo0J